MSKVRVIEPESTPQIPEVINTAYGDQNNPLRALYSNNDWIMNWVNLYKDKYDISDFRARGILFNRFKKHQNLYDNITEDDKFEGLSTMLDFKSNLPDEDDDYVHGFYNDKGEWTLQLNYDRFDDNRIEDASLEKIIKEYNKKAKENNLTPITTEEIENLNDNEKSTLTDIAIKAIISQEQNKARDYQMMNKSTAFKYFGAGAYNAIVSTIPLPSSWLPTIDPNVNKSALYELMTLTNDKYKKDIENVLAIEEQTDSDPYKHYVRLGAQTIGTSVGFVAGLFFGNGLLKLFKGVKVIGGIGKIIENERKLAEAAPTFIEAIRATKESATLGDWAVGYGHRLLQATAEGYVTQTPAGIRDAIENVVLNKKDLEAGNIVYDAMLNRQLEVISEALIMEGKPAALLGRKVGINVWNIIPNFLTEEVTNAAQDIFEGTNTFIFNKDGEKYEYDPQIGALIMGTAFGAAFAGGATIINTTGVSKAKYKALRLLTEVGLTLKNSGSELLSEDMKTALFGEGNENIAENMSTAEILFNAELNAGADNLKLSTPDGKTIVPKKGQRKAIEQRYEDLLAYYEDEIGEAPSGLAKQLLKGRAILDIALFNTEGKSKLKQAYNSDVNNKVIQKVTNNMYENSKSKETVNYINDYLDANEIKDKSIRETFISSKVMGIKSSEIEFSKDPKKQIAYETLYDNLNLSELNKEKPGLRELDFGKISLRMVLAENLPGKILKNIDRHRRNELINEGIELIENKYKKTYDEASSITSDKKLRAIYALAKEFKLDDNSSLNIKALKAMNILKSHYKFAERMITFEDYLIEAKNKETKDRITEFIELFEDKEEGKKTLISMQLTAVTEEMANLLNNMGVKVDEGIVNKLHNLLTSKEEADVKNYIKTLLNAVSPKLKLHSILRDYINTAFNIRKAVDEVYNGMVKPAKKQPVKTEKKEEKKEEKPEPIIPLDTVSEKIITSDGKITTSIKTLYILLGLNSESDKIYLNEQKDRKKVIAILKDRLNNGEINDTDIIALDLLDDNLNFTLNALPANHKIFNLLRKGIKDNLYEGLRNLSKEEFISTVSDKLELTEEEAQDIWTIVNAKTNKEFKEAYTKAKKLSSFFNHHHRASFEFNGKKYELFNKGEAIIGFLSEYPFSDETPIPYGSSDFFKIKNIIVAKYFNNYVDTKEIVSHIIEADDEVIEELPDSEDKPAKLAIVAYYSKLLERNINEREQLKEPESIEEDESEQDYLLNEQEKSDNKIGENEIVLAYKGDIEDSIANDKNISEIIQTIMSLYHSNDLIKSNKDITDYINSLQEDEQALLRGFLSEILYVTHRSNLYFNVNSESSVKISKSILSAFKSIMIKFANRADYYKNLLDEKTISVLNKYIEDFKNDEAFYKRKKNYNAIRTILQEDIDNEKLELEDDQISNAVNYIIASLYDNNQVITTPFIPVKIYSQLHKRVRKIVADNLNLSLDELERIKDMPILIYHNADTGDFFSSKSSLTTANMKKFGVIVRKLKKIEDATPIINSLETVLKYFNKTDPRYKILQRTLNSLQKEEAEELAEEEIIKPQKSNKIRKAKLKKRKAKLEAQKKEELDNRKGNTISPSEIERRFVKKRDSDKIQEILTEALYYFSGDFNPNKRWIDKEDAIFNDLIKLGLKPDDEGHLTDPEDITDAMAENESRIKKEINEDIKKEGLKKVTNEFRTQTDAKKIKEIEAKYQTELDAINAELVSIEEENIETKEDKIYNAFLEVKGINPDEITSESRVKSGETELKVNKEQELEIAKRDILNQSPQKTIVNEIFQNSIDAGAKNIDVVINEETDTIIFKDNGSGMSTQEVIDNFLTLGNIGSKSETSAGGFGRAKAAFLLYPKSIKLRTTKRGKTTTFEATPEIFKKGKVNYKVEKTKESNGTIIEVKLHKGDYYRTNRAIKNFSEIYQRDVNINVTSNYKNLSETKNYKPTKGEQKYPTIKIKSEGSIIEVSFIKQPIDKHRFKVGGKYGIDVDVLNKGIPLSFRVPFDTIKNPDFKIIINFKKTPTTQSENYPFIKNRTELLDKVRADIKKPIEKFIEGLDKEHFENSVTDLKEEIDKAPIYGGTKVILREIKTTEGKEKVKKILSENSALLTEISKGFEAFKKILKDIGEKDIELVLSVNPKTYGWRPDETLGIREVYAINPFAIDKLTLDKIYSDAAELGVDPDRMRASNIVHTMLHEYTHNYFDKHNENFTVKLSEFYTKITHKTLTEKVENIFYNILKTKGEEYENIQKILGDVYRGLAEVGEIISKSEIESGRLQGRGGETTINRSERGLRQEAQEIYSQYVEQTGRQDIEGFKEFLRGVLQKKGEKVTPTEKGRETALKTQSEANYDVWSEAKIPIPKEFKEIQKLYSKVFELLGERGYKILFDSKLDRLGKHSAQGKTITLRTEINPETKKESLTDPDLQKVVLIHEILHGVFHVAYTENYNINEQNLDNLYEATKTIKSVIKAAGSDKIIFENPTKKEKKYTKRRIKDIKDKYFKDSVSIEEVTNWIKTIQEDSNISGMLPVAAGSNKKKIISELFSNVLSNTYTPFTLLLHDLKPIGMDIKEGKKTSKSLMTEIIANLFKVFKDIAEFVKGKDEDLYKQIVTLASNLIIEDNPGHTTNIKGENIREYKNEDNYPLSDNFVNEIGDYVDIDDFPALSLEEKDTDGNAFLNYATIKEILNLIATLPNDYDLIKGEPFEEQVANMSFKTFERLFIPIESDSDFVLDIKKQLNSLVYKSADYNHSFNSMANETAAAKYIDLYIKMRNLVKTGFVDVVVKNGNVYINKKNVNHFRNSKGANISDITAKIQLEQFRDILSEVLGIDKKVRIFRINEFIGYENGKQKASFKYARNYLDQISSVAWREGYIYLNQFADRGTSVMLEIPHEYNKEEIFNKVREVYELYNKLLNGNNDINKELLDVEKERKIVQSEADKLKQKIIIDGEFTRTEEQEEEYKKTKDEYAKLENKLWGIDQKVNKIKGRVATQGLRTLLEDLKVGNTYDNLMNESLEDKERTRLLKDDGSVWDFISLMNRWVLSSMIANPVIEKSIIDKLRLSSDKNKGVYFKKEKDGKFEIYFRTVFWNTSDFKNKLGISRVDGGIIIKKYAGRILRKVFGIVNQGSLKNYYFNEGSYFKEAMHEYSNDDSIIKALDENNAVMMINETVEKNYGLNHFKYKYSTLKQIKDGKAKVYDIPLSKFNKIKEGANEHESILGLSQVFNATNIVPQNKWVDSGLSEYFIKITKESVNSLNKTNQMEAYQIVKDMALKISSAPRNYDEVLFSRMYESKKIIDMPIEDLFNELSRLKADPVVSRIFSYVFNKKIIDTVKMRNTGTDITIMPDLGNEAQTRIESAKDDYIIDILWENTDKKTENLILDYFNIDNKISELHKKISGKFTEYEDRKDYQAALKKRKETLNKLKKLDSWEKIKDSDYLKEKLNKAFDENGFLKFGYGMITRDIADRLNINVGDKVAYYLIPSDSATSISSMEVAGIIELEDSSHNGFITNSEFLQAMLGRDFDIDVMYFLPKPNYFTEDDWKDFNDKLLKTYHNYVNGLYDTFEYVFDNIDKEELFKRSGNVEARKKLKRLTARLKRLYKLSEIIQMYNKEQKININFIKSLIRNMDSVFIKNSNINSETVGTLKDYIKKNKSINDKGKNKLINDEDIQTRAEELIEQLLDKVSEVNNQISEISKGIKYYKPIVKKDQKLLEAEYKKILADKKNLFKLIESKDKDEILLSKQNIIFNSALRKRFMQLMLGIETKIRPEDEKYNPIEPESNKIGGMYYKEIGSVIVLRELFTALSALHYNDNIVTEEGLSVPEGKEWNAVHTMLLIATNDYVDYPKNMNKSYYKSEIPNLRARMVSKDTSNIDDEAAEPLYMNVYKQIVSLFNIPRAKSINSKNNAERVMGINTVKMVKSIKSINKRLNPRIKEKLSILPIFQLLNLDIDKVSKWLESFLAPFTKEEQRDMIRETEYQTQLNLLEEYYGLKDFEGVLDDLIDYMYGDSDTSKTDNYLKEYSRNIGENHTHFILKLREEAKIFHHRINLRKENINKSDLLTHLSKYFFLHFEGKYYPIREHIVTAVLPGSWFEGRRGAENDPFVFSNILINLLDKTTINFANKHNKFNEPMTADNPEGEAGDYNFHMFGSVDNENYDLWVHNPTGTVTLIQHKNGKDYEVERANSGSIANNSLIMKFLTNLDNYKSQTVRYIINYFNLNKDNFTEEERIGFVIDYLNRLKREGQIDIKVLNRLFTSLLGIRSKKTVGAALGKGMNPLQAISNDRVLKIAAHVSPKWLKTYYENYKENFKYIAPSQGLFDSYRAGYDYEEILDPTDIEYFPDVNTNDLHDIRFLSNPSTKKFGQLFEKNKLAALDKLKNEAKKLVFSNLLISKGISYGNFKRKSLDEQNEIMSDFDDILLKSYYDDIEKLDDVYDAKRKYYAFTRITNKLPKISDKKRWNSQLNIDALAMFFSRKIFFYNKNIKIAHGKLTYDLVNTFRNVKKSFKDITPNDYAIDLKRVAIEAQPSLRNPDTQARALSLTDIYQTKLRELNDAIVITRTEISRKMESISQVYNNLSDKEKITKLQKVEDLLYEIGDLHNFSRYAVKENVYIYKISEEISKDDYDKYKKEEEEIEEENKDKSISYKEKNDKYYKDHNYNTLEELIKNNIEGYEDDVISTAVKLREIIAEDLHSFLRSVQIFFKFISEQSDISVFSKNSIQRKLNNYNRIAMNLVTGDHRYDAIDKNQHPKYSFVPKVFDKVTYLELRADKIASKKEDNELTYEERYVEAYENLEKSLARNANTEWVTVLHGELKGKDLKNYTIGSLDSAFLFVVEQLTNMVRSDITEYYGNTYMTNAIRFGESKFVRNKMRRLFINNGVKGKIKTTTTLIENVKPDDMILFHKKETKMVKIRGKREEQQDIYTTVTGIVEEVNNDKIVINNRGIIEEYDINNIYSFDYDGNVIPNSVDKYTEFNKNWAVWKIARRMTDGMVANIRGYLRVWKSRIQNKIGLFPSVGFENMTWLPKVISASRRNKLSGKVDTIIKIRGEEDEAKYKEVFSSVNSLGAKTLLDVFTGVEQSDLDPFKILGNEVKDGFILTRLANQTKNAIKMNKIVKQTTKYQKYLDELRKLDKQIREEKNTEEKQRLLDLRGKLRILASKENSEVNDIMEELEQDEGMKELYKEAKEMIDKGNLAFLHQLNKNQAIYIRNKYVRDLFIDKRLQYINEIEGEIRTTSFNLRFLASFEKYNDFELALYHAKQGVKVDHALYTALDKILSASSDKGRVMQGLRQFSYNQSIMLLMNLQNVREDSAVYGFKYLLYDLFKHLNKTNDKSIQNPLARLTSTLVMNNTLWMLSQFTGIGSFQFFMNPILQVIYSLAEILVGLGADDDDDKPDRYDWRFFGIGVSNLFGGYGVSALTGLLYDLITYKTEEDEYGDKINNYWEAIGKSFAGLFLQGGGRAASKYYKLINRGLDKFAAGNQDGIIDFIQAIAYTAGFPFYLAQPMAIVAMAAHGGIGEFIEALINPLYYEMLISNRKEELDESFSVNAREMYLKRKKEKIEKYREAGASK